MQMILLLIQITQNYLQTNYIQRKAKGQEGIRYSFRKDKHQDRRLCLTRWVIVKYNLVVLVQRQTSREYHRVPQINSDILVSLGCCNKILQTGGLKHQIFVTHSSGDQRSKIKVLADLVYCKGPIPGLQTDTFLLFSHVFSHGGRGGREREKR